MLLFFFFFCWIQYFVRKNLKPRIMFLEVVAKWSAKPPNSLSQHIILSSFGCQMLDSTTKFWYSILLWLPDARFYHQILIFYPPLVARCLILPPNSDILSSCGCQMLDSTTKFWYSILLWLPDAWFYHQILIFYPPVVARC